MLAAFMRNCVLTVRAREPAQGCRPGGERACYDPRGQATSDWNDHPPSLLELGHIGRRVRSAWDRRPNKWRRS